MSPTRTLPRPGDIFEQRYELLEILGTGGMGTVFKAKQLETGRFIALKVLQSSSEDPEENRERFLREARALNMLSHPNIVTVYHLGISIDGIPFIAMEMINGQTLRKLLFQESKIEPIRAMRLILQCCSALGAMHQAGIVHRDIKPENIVLLDDISPELVKIIDFGLVHLLNSDQKLTATGILIGSVNYMSPEQCQGVPAGVQSDLYSLSACLFELLTGRPPFEADSSVGVMYKHSHEAVPAIDKDIAYAEELDEFIKKGLEKASEKRFASAELMAASLEEIIDMAQRTASAPPLELKLKRIFRKYKKSIAVLTFATFLSMVSLMVAKEIDINRSRTEINIAKTAAEKKFTDPILKAEHLIRIAELKSGTQEGIAAGEEAFAIAKVQQKRGRASALLERAMYVLSRNYESVGEFQKAIPLFQQLAAISHERINELNDEVTWQDVLSSKAHLAKCYFSVNEVNKSKAIVQELANWDGGLRMGAAEGCIQVFLRLHDDKGAKRIISIAMDPGCLIELIETCRSLKRDDLADLALARARKLKNEEAYDKYPNEIYKLDLAEAEILLDRHKLAPAREILKKLYVDQWHKQEDGYLLFRFAKSLKAAGMLTEAEISLPDRKLNSPTVACTKADVFVSNGKFAEAKNIIDKYKISSRGIRDPETGADTTVQARMARIESGKAKYKAGLESFD